MIVGLTGGIGCGKTTVAALFEAFDSVAVYIADTEARKIMNSSEVIRTQLIAAFGEESFTANLLNRTYVANVVFENKEKLAILNRIVHPEVKKDFQKFVAANAHKGYILYESAILFESKSTQQFDFIISVFVHLEERIRRVVARDNTTRKEVLSKMNNQWKGDKIVLLSNYIIHNYTPQETAASVAKIHKILTKKALHIL